MGAWLGLSLAVAAYFGLQALIYSFSTEYIVQDDARQHVFWMERFRDPELFPQDLIADYFQSVAPPGYTAFYWLCIHLGLPPLLISKVLPLILGLITTLYAFGVCWQILPLPRAAFWATVILNQSLWLKNDLVSATPRAFLYPLFLAFLYYLLRRRWGWCLGAIALQGLFYPHFVLVCLGILVLRLGRWQGGWWRWSKQRSDYGLLILALVVAAVVLLPYKLGNDPYGPIVTLSQAQLEPEFAHRGRSFFFDPNPIVYWFTGERSGMLFLPLPPTLLAGLALPGLLHHRDRWPLVRRFTTQVNLFGQILLASIGLFCLAHLFLFQLHLPSRYIQHSLRIVLALAGGMVLGIVLPKLGAAIGQWSRQTPRRSLQSLMALLAVLCLSGFLLLPFLPQISLPYQDWIIGNKPEFYAYLRQQPKSTLIASLSLEVSNVPTFAHRSILFGWEYALPYHQGYYQPFRQRVVDLIRAQYSPDLQELRNFIQTYGVDLLVVDGDALTVAYLEKSRWARHHPAEIQAAIAQLEAGTVPALATLMQRCAATKLDGPVILETTCIVQATTM